MGGGRLVTLQADVIATIPSVSQFLNEQTRFFRGSLFSWGPCLGESRCRMSNSCNCIDLLLNLSRPIYDMSTLRCHHVTCRF